MEQRNSEVSAIGLPASAGSPHYGAFDLRSQKLYVLLASQSPAAVYFSIMMSNSLYPVSGENLSPDVLLLLNFSGKSERSTLTLA